TCSPPSSWTRFDKIWVMWTPKCGAASLAGSKAGSPKRSTVPASATGRATCVARSLAKTCATSRSSRISRRSTRRCTVFEAPGHSRTLTWGTFQRARCFGHVENVPHDEKPHRRGTMFQTIHAAAEAIRQGRITPLELLDACLANIDRWESKVHAWVFVD